MKLSIDKLRVSELRVSELRVSDLVPLPLDVDAWQREALAPFTVLERRSLFTKTGWPLALLTATGPAGERAVAAFYTFFEYGAWAASAGDLSDELLEVFRSAEPDWRARGLITCLADLWN